MLDSWSWRSRSGAPGTALSAAPSSYPVHPEQRSRSLRCSTQIAVLFRALGGQTGTDRGRRGAQDSGHRLGWRQRIGLGDECLDAAGPRRRHRVPAGRIDVFPERELNVAALSLARRLVRDPAGLPVIATPIRCGAIF